MHFSFSSPSIINRGENLISRWQLNQDCMLGHINPTQNIPEERSRLRICSLPDARVKFFYSSPSGLTAVKFCVLKIWLWLEHQETIPFFFFFFWWLEHFSSRGKMQVQTPHLNDPNVPFLKWILLTTQICSQLKSASVLRLWILLSWQDLILILKYVSWTLKFMFSFLVFHFFPVSPISSALDKHVSCPPSFSA